MTSINALSEHIQEFAQEVKALEEQYGLKIVVDHIDETLMLVNNENSHSPVAWLGLDEIKYDADYISVDNVELSKILDPVMKDDDLEA